MRFKQYLQEAKPEVDLDHRDSANTIFNNLLSILKNKTNFDKYFFKYGEDGLGIKMAHFDKVAIIVLFPEEKHVIGAFTVLNNKGHIVFYVLPELFDVKKDLKNIYNVVKKNKGELIHEIIHYLDSNRTPTTIWTKKQTFVIGDTVSRLELYYNSPIEFNAIYQAFVINLEDKIKQISKESITLSLTDPNFFLTLFKKWKPEPWEYFNTKYKRKLIKRLAVTQQDFKKRLTKPPK